MRTSLILVFHAAVALCQSANSLCMVSLRVVDSQGMPVPHTVWSFQNEAGQEFALRRSYGPNSLFAFRLQSPSRANRDNNRHRANIKHYGCFFSRELAHFGHQSEPILRGGPSLFGIVGATLRLRVARASYAAAR